MKTKLTLLLLCCTTLALPAFADDKAMAEKAKADKAAQADHMAMATGDQEHVNKAAHGGHAEVAAGNLAKTNASSAAVKQYGEMMVTDHGKANMALETAAKASNLMVPADAGDHQMGIDKLGGMKGAAFDKAFMDMMVKDHRDTVKLLEMMSKDAKSAQLKEWAKMTLPTVQGHLKKAEELQKSMK